MAMWEGERKNRDVGNGEHLVGLDLVQREPGLGRAFVRTHSIIENVIEGPAETGEGFCGSIDRKRLSLGKNPEVVDPIDVIGVLVGIYHSIDPGKSGTEQLETELGRCVDQNGRAARVDDGYGAGALVPQVRRAAHRAPASGLG